MQQGVSFLCPAVHFSLVSVFPPNHLFISLMTSKLIYKAVIHTARNGILIAAWTPVSVNWARREQWFPREWQASSSYTPLEDDMSSSSGGDAQSVLVTLSPAGLDCVTVPQSNTICYKHWIVTDQCLGSHPISGCAFSNTRKWYSIKGQISFFLFKRLCL